MNDCAMTSPVLNINFESSQQKPVANFYFYVINLINRKFHATPAILLLLFTVWQTITFLNEHHFNIKHFQRAIRMLNKTHLNGSSQLVISCRFLWPKRRTKKITLPVPENRFDGTKLKLD